MGEVQPEHSGWPARLELCFRRKEERTVLVRRRHYGPLTVQRPFYPGDGACHVYILHPPGGVVGGDSLHVDVTADRASRCLLTTPGAGKFYRSGGPTASLLQTLKADEDSVIEWLPQENIYFPGSEVNVSTRIDLADGGQVIMWDMHCFGRPANQETFESGRVDASLALYRERRPLLLERQRVDCRTRRGRALLAGRAVSGLLIASKCDESTLKLCRKASMHTSNIGVTRIDDLIIARYLGDSTLEGRREFTRLWAVVREQATGMRPTAPRIWRT